MIWSKKVVEQPHIVETPFFLIDHQTLYWHCILPTSTQHDGSIHDLKKLHRRRIRKRTHFLSKTYNTLHRQMSLQHKHTHKNGQIYHGHPELLMHK
jgi:hypothetical protein